MRAAALYGSELRLVDIPEPVPGDREVLVAVHRAGICGTDLLAHTYGLPDGFVLGHEISGRIVDVGGDVDPGRIGQRVAVLPVIGCGSCRPCGAGHLTHCPTHRSLGITTQGGFSERVVAGAQQALPLPDDVGYGQGALVEPLAIALHIVRRAHLDGLERVLVVGAGPIGLAVTMWLRRMGIDGIVVSDPVDGRRNLARACGAEYVIDPNAEGIAAVLRSVCGGKPNVIFDCAGGRVGEAVSLVRRDGKIIVAGYHAAPVPIDTQQALVKELDVVFASWYTTAEYTHTLAAVSRNALPTDAIVTHCVALDDLPAAYASLKRPNDQGKVLIDLVPVAVDSGFGTP